MLLQSLRRCKEPLAFLAPLSSMSSGIAAVVIESVEVFEPTISAM